MGSERRKWHFRGSNFKKFPGGHAPVPPSIAIISAMIPSDLRLDPPLSCVCIQHLINIKNFGKNSEITTFFDNLNNSEP